MLFASLIFLRHNITGWRLQQYEHRKQLSPAQNTPALQAKFDATVSFINELIVIKTGKLGFHQRSVVIEYRGLTVTNTSPLTFFFWLTRNSANAALKKRTLYRSRQARVVC